MRGNAQEEFVYTTTRDVIQIHNDLYISKIRIISQFHEY